jgi:hypothetical protein
MKKCFTQSFFIASVSTLMLFLCIQLGFAQVRSSTNYQLQSDSINMGGGYSTSTSYQQESTAGEIATGEATSTNYQLKAGYQQMQEVYLSMSTPTDVTMTPSLPGLTGGTSNGSTTVTVTTDSPSGYSLTISAADSPAMQNGVNSIADYVEGADPDYSFTVTSGAATFGFSPSSIDAVSAFRDNGSLCNVGSLDTALACWAGLTTSDTVISQGIGANHPDGATTTINFRVGVGSNAGIAAGLYTATTTLTALPL